MPPRRKYRARKCGSGYTVPHGVLDDGRKVTLDMVRLMMPGVFSGIVAGVKEHRFIPGNYEQATAIFEQLIAKEPIVEFLTNYCYEVME